MTLKTQEYDLIKFYDYVAVLLLLLLLSSVHPCFLGIAFRLTTDDLYARKN